MLNNLTYQNCEKLEKYNKLSLFKHFNLWALDLDIYNSRN